MKTIILVSFKNNPMRAFNNKEKAIEWIKEISEQYKQNISDYSMKSIFIYE